MIDCHTHSVFGGNRSVEFEKRLQGVSYAEIAASGGGIASTVRATREASEEQLLSSALKRIRCMQKDGVTTIEIKSGYGLNYENERKMLRVIRQIGEALPMTVKALAWLHMRYRQSTKTKAMLISSISVQRCCLNYMLKV